MNTSAAWVHVLRAPWDQRRNQGSTWLWYVVGAIALILAGMVTAMWPHVAIGALAASAAATFGAAFWLWLAASLMQQNAPHVARLVPGHARMLRRVMAGAALALVGLAMAIGACFGQALLAGASTAAALFVIVWIVRVPQLGFIAWLIPATQSRWASTPGIARLGDMLEQAWRADPMLCGAGTIAAFAALGVLSLNVLVQDGDARHQAVYRQRAKRRAALCSGRGEQASWVHSSRLGALFRFGAQALYRRRLARVSEQRSGSVLARSIVGLGPNVHWSGFVGSALTYGVLGALVLALVWNIGTHGTRGFGIAWPLSIGALSFAVSIGASARMALHHTRREQALLMLLPGMPRGAVLNRQLAWLLLAQFIGCWAAATLLCVALVGSGNEVTGWTPIVALACLPCVALLWRDWSRLHQPSAMTAMTPVMLSAASALAGLALFAWLHVSPLQLGVGYVALALALLAWRWRAMRELPQALPAGRTTAAVR